MLLGSTRLTLRTPYNEVQCGQWPLIRTPDAKPGQRLVTTTGTNLRRHPAAKPAAIIGKAIVNSRDPPKVKAQEMKSVDIVSSNSTDICKWSSLHHDGVAGESQSDKPGAQGDECKTSAVLIFSCMSYQYNYRCYEFFLSLPTISLPSSITPGYARGQLKFKMGMSRFPTPTALSGQCR